MKPAVLNLELFKGDDYDLTLSFVDQADAPIDLSTRTFVVPVRRFADSRDTTLFTVDAADAVSGVLRLSLPSSATDLLVSGEWLLQETIGGKRHTILGGRLAVVQEARGVAEGVTAMVRMAPDVVRVVTTGTTGPQGASGAGTSPAGGVLAGSYPNPSFAVDMATQAELDAVDAASSKKAANLSDLASAATARTNLGLGSAATHPVTDFDTAGAAAAAQAASQPADSDLTAIAALSTTAFGRGLLALADAAAGRAALALGSAATASTTDFDPAGAAAAAAAALVASAPTTLDTLNELATALGDDPNFATTITAALGGKQPLDSDLTAIAALTTTAFGRSFLALADAAAGRTLLGLGSAALAATGDFDASGAAAAAQAASQPLDSDLTAIAALATTAFGRSFLALADAAAGRTLLALGSAATQASAAFDAAGAAAAAQAASQPLDSDLTAIAALTTTAFGRSVLDRADAAALRTLAGLGSLATLSTITSTEITDGTITDTDVAAANKDGAAGTASLRTLGDGAAQAAQGSKRARILDEVHADAGSASSAAEQTLATLLLPGGVVAVGDKLVFVAFGDCINNSGGSLTIQFRLKFGATTVLDTTALTMLTSANRRKWWCEVTFSFPTLTSQRIAGPLEVSSTATTSSWQGGTTAPFNLVGYGTAAEDTSTDKNVVLTAQLQSSLSTLDVFLHGASLELVKK